MVNKHLDNNKFTSKIEYTKKAKHAIEISKKNSSIFDIIVAVGGDGSVNEVGKSLINTNTTLAIIPAGSGNGLARDLGISMNIKNAIEHINKGKVKQIDTVKINDEYFLGTAGVGFDAFISWKFDEAPTRGILTYVKVALIGFWKYKPVNYNIEYNNLNKIIKEGFLVTFSNSKQYGNNILISPKSKIDDGLIRLIVIKKFSIIYLPIFLYYLLRGQINKFKFTEEFTSNKFTLFNTQSNIHIDGEPIKMDKTLKIKVIPKSLNIIVP